MERIDQKIESFLRTGEGDFESLALELFAYQFDRNQPYQAFCRAQGRSSGAVKNWQDIPAVPIQAFKSSALTTFPIERAAAIFHSSSTTRDVPSRHFLKTLTYYETSLNHSFAHHVIPEKGVKLPILILAPSPAEALHSSLSWMLDVVMRRYGSSGGGYFIQRGRLDEFALFRALAYLQATPQSVLLLGTTLGFLALFEACERQGKKFTLPAGSRIMDTGGMKTEKRDVTRAQFLTGAHGCLGIPEADCINEYGMCELGSQFYARGASTHFQGPPWIRARAIDPVTGADAGPGQTGLLQFLDLANVDSVSAILTEDQGILKPNGFEWRGRAPQAALKGCSLAAEAYFR